MTRLGPLLAATAALAVVLTACDPGGDPDPNYSSVTPTASASTSASTSPTASPSPSVPTTGPNSSPGEVAPTEPASATSNDSAGAISFVGYYVKMSDWVFATSEVSILDSFYAPGCSTCTTAQENLGKLIAGGSHFRGGRITIRDVQVVRNDGRLSADYAITSVTDVGAADVVSPSGAVIQSFPASSGFQLTDWVRFVDGRWQIVEERKV